MVQFEVLLHIRDIGRHSRFGTLLPDIFNDRLLDVGPAFGNNAIFNVCGDQYVGFFRRPEFRSHDWSRVRCRGKSIIIVLSNSPRTGVSDSVTLLKNLIW